MAMMLHELVSDVLAFRTYLRAERGMAANTVEAYGRDLERYSEWAARIRLADYTAPTLSDLSRYWASCTMNNSPRRASPGTWSR